jgi:hypothetical protein
MSFGAFTGIGVVRDHYPSDYVLSAVGIERHPSNILKFQHEPLIIPELKMYDSARWIKFHSH